MTRISSYQLLQCLSCGQKHILAKSRSINLTFDPPPEAIKPDDLWVCQRCSERKSLKGFIPLGILQSPISDATPKWYKPIRRFFDKNYKEPEPHPTRLYPDLDKTPFDPENYYPAWIRKNMIEEDYPEWYFELANKVKKQMEKA
jgi:DNA-directed RNA polymerase subunit RPC12/RpoP